MIRLAQKAENVSYICLPAEMSEEQLVEHQLLDDSFDLITVAGGVHYFKLETFHRLVERLLKKGAHAGAYAVWCFNDPLFDENPALHDALKRYERSLDEFGVPELNIWRDKY